MLVSPKFYEHINQTSVYALSQEIIQEFEEGFAAFDRARPVVLVCPQGTVSAEIAERMQRAGFEAYSLRGGVRTLLRLRLIEEPTR